MCSKNPIPPIYGLKVQKTAVLNKCQLKIKAYKFKYPLLTDTQDLTETQNRPNRPTAPP